MATISKEAYEVDKGICGTSILDLSIDNIVQCTSPLCIKDSASMAMTCKHLREAVYVDSIWENQCSKRWPPKQVFGSTFQFCGGRKACQERHTASQKFQFFDPMEWQIKRTGEQVHHLLMEDNSIIVAEGSSVTAFDIESQATLYTLTAHKAKITCMRSVPSEGIASSRIASSRSSGDSADSVLVTSSMDHTIRLWNKGIVMRTLRGHSRSIATLSNSLLGRRYGRPTLASGGVDGTIWLWPLSSGQKRVGKKGFRGHELAVKQLVVPEYNPSLLVSAGKDLKLRVWDVTSTLSGTVAAALVGSMKLPGVPVGLVCKGSMCYVAGGVNLMLVDLRSMQTTATILAHKSGILNFSTPASREAFCTGGEEKTAKLWDLRNIEEPYATLGGHSGDVNFVHMDHYKVVTAGSTDEEVYMWDAETGDQLSSLENDSNSKLTNLVVKGTHIATATDNGCIHFRDFSNCAVPMVHNELSNHLEETSKFWETSFD